MVSTTNQREGRVKSLVRLKTLESTFMLRELAIMHKENCSKITVVKLTYEDIDMQYSKLVTAAIR